MWGKCAGAITGIAIAGGGLSDAVQVPIVHVCLLVGVCPLAKGASSRELVSVFFLIRAFISMGSSYRAEIIDWQVLHDAIVFPSIFIRLVRQPANT